MIKRTIEISTGPTHLAIRHDQLVISREREVVGTVPCEDIGVLIVDQVAVTCTQSVLADLARAGAVIIVCDGSHHPCAYVWPVEGNGLHTERLRLQVEASRPLGKRVWQQVVQAKISAQAARLGEGHPAYRKLLALADTVRSGDPSNVEAHAAKVYWQALFPDQGFHRDPDGPPPNNLLNYGYMAIRAAVARAICAAGLHPSIGFHHRNRYNAFCLADDLVEPFRPLVDGRVHGLWGSGCREITRESKAELLGVLTAEVETADGRGPLMVALGRMMASLVRVMEGGEKRLEIPVPCG